MDGTGFYCGKITQAHVYTKHTHWFVDPEDVSAVCEGLIRPEVSHGLGLDP